MRSVLRLGLGFGAFGVLMAIGAAGAGAETTQPVPAEPVSAAQLTPLAPVAPPVEAPLPAPPVVAPLPAAPVVTPVPAVPVVTSPAAPVVMPTPDAPAIVPATAFTAPAVVDELPARHSPVALAPPTPAVAAPKVPAAVVRPSGAASSAAPAPAPPGGAGRKIVYSNSQQRVWLYESDGGLVDTYLVSGRAGVPRPGNYTVFSKSPVAWSGKVTMQWMVRFARGRSLAIGFHSIPVGRRGPIQSLAELGRFRSAGCVRQAPANARRLWDFAPIGTRVVVTR